MYFNKYPLLVSITLINGNNYSNEGYYAFYGCYQVKLYKYNIADSTIKSATKASDEEAGTDGK